jgi:ribosomal protein S18 acetylase RimI-like enzyme
VEVILNIDLQMKIRIFKKSDEKHLIQLWKDCDLVVPWNNPRTDVERKLKENEDEILVGLIDGKIMATAIVGYDGHRGWVYYLAVHPEYQRKGYGDQIMKFAEEYLLNMGCPKINIMVRKTNLKVINFYKAIGYLEDNVVTLSKRLIPDD